MSKALRISTCSIISTHLKRPVTKNIEQALVHIITSNIDYFSPSDRVLSICIEGVVTSKDIVDLRIEITPCYVDVHHTIGHQNLHKSIMFSTQIPLSNLLDEFTKEIRWVLDYFGLTIMYITKHFKHIKIEKQGKGYTLEYCK